MMQGECEKMLLTWRRRDGDDGGRLRHDRCAREKIDRLLRQASSNCVDDWSACTCLDGLRPQVYGHRKFMFAVSPQFQ